MTETRLRREAIRALVLDSSKYHSVNENYVRTVPPTHLGDDRGPNQVIDYEPHCYGHGYYDEPDATPFQEAFVDRIYDKCKKISSSSRKVTRLNVKNCEQLLPFSYYYRERDVSDDDVLELSKLFRAIYLPLSPDEEKSSSVSDDEAIESETEVDPEVIERLHQIQEARQLLSVLESTKILEVDCKEWKPVCSSYHDGNCLSACLLSLFLIFPNVEALRIKWMYMDSTSLFANFPIPRPLNVATSSSLTEQQWPPITISEHLKILSFDHCGDFHPMDLPFLTDCAVEHRVLPNLRHLQFYYCNGMSYPSVVTASEVFNLDFDRFELSGWCWPQEAVNSKNLNIHY